MRARSGHGGMDGMISKEAFMKAHEAIFCLVSGTVRQPQVLIGRDRDVDQFRLG